LLPVSQGILSSLLHFRKKVASTSPDDVNFVNRCIYDMITKKPNDFKQIVKMKTSQGIMDEDTIGDDRRNSFLKSIRIGQTGYFNPDRPQKTGL
jgi:hypothetical protein